MQAVLFKTSPLKDGQLCPAGPAVVRFGPFPITGCSARLGLVGRSIVGKLDADSSDPPRLNGDAARPEKDNSREAAMLGRLIQTNHLINIRLNLQAIVAHSRMQAPDQGDRPVRDRGLSPISRSRSDWPSCIALEPACVVPGDP